MNDWQDSTRNGMSPAAQLLTAFSARVAPDPEPYARWFVLGVRVNSPQPTRSRREVLAGGLER